MVRESWQFEHIFSLKFPRNDIFGTYQAHPWITNNTFRQIYITVLA